MPSLRPFTAHNLTRGNESKFSRPLTRMSSRNQLERFYEISCNKVKLSNKINKVTKEKLLSTINKKKTI